MTELVATTPGLYPLPDDAKDDLSDLKGHQKEDLIDGDEGEEVRNVYDRARREVVDVQTEAGLDRVVEGQLRWDDMLAHPLTVHDAVETRGLVRYYDNNNFYRDPVVTDDLDVDGDVAAELEALSGLTDDPLQAVLPGPYSLASLATDEHYGDEAEFLAAVAEFLAGEAGAFPEVETLWLLEPSLVTDPPGDGPDARASEAVDRVAGAVDADVVVHPYWGALDETVHAHLLDADVDAVGYDFVTEHESNLYNINEYGTCDDVALGLVDGQNTLVEAPATVADRVEWVREGTPGADFDRAYVTSNTPLFYLPYTRFEAKVRTLAGAVDADPTPDDEAEEVSA
ncbi:5-methyltetrahydropteroyltriglutamate--homocysteine methyltransferase [Halobacteriales archaeon QS_8_69_26]|nr:MAG: 5-methyltetrahydropteroyltriglutamate--homocysteine methyltransferase [Halobacteriales archaeon QS_8_69_26]